MNDHQRAIQPAQQTPSRQDAPLGLGAEALLLLESRLPVIALLAGLVLGRLFA